MFCVYLRIPHSDVVIRGNLPHLDKRITSALPLHRRRPTRLFLVLNLGAILVLNALSVLRFSDARSLHLTPLGNAPLHTQSGRRPVWRRRWYRCALRVKLTLPLPPAWLCCMFASMRGLQSTKSSFLNGQCAPPPESQSSCRA